MSLLCFYSVGLKRRQALQNMSVYIAATDKEHPLLSGMDTGMNVGNFRSLCTTDLNMTVKTEMTSGWLFEFQHITCMDTDLVKNAKALPIQMIKYITNVFSTFLNSLSQLRQQITCRYDNSFCL